MTRIIGLVVAAVFAFGAVADAEPTARQLAELKRRFSKGNKLYAEGQYEEALRLYLAAYALVPSVDILFNIALAKEKVLDFEDCALSFREYVAGASEKDPLRARAQAGYARCRERSKIPVKISSNPAGAAIAVGEAGAAVFRGRTPRDLSMPPGDYVVSVTLPGYTSMSQKVHVDVGTRPEIDFPLERLSSISIEADVAGAKVAIDDLPPEPAPIKREVKAGVYKIRVFKSGHKTVEREVRVEPGQQATLMMALPENAVQRAVSIRSNVPAVVHVGGKKLGRTPLRAKLAAGQHDIAVRASARIPFADSIEVPRDRDVDIEIELARGRTRTERTVMWALAGSSLAAATAATVYGALALSDESSFADRPDIAVADRGESRAQMADVLWGTSLALAVGATVTYFATDRESGVKR